jgi:hypothetical protein
MELAAMLFEANPNEPPSFEGVDVINASLERGMDAARQTVQILNLESETCAKRQAFQNQFLNS